MLDDGSSATMRRHNYIPGTKQTTYLPIRVFAAHSLEYNYLSGIVDMWTNASPMHWNRSWAYRHFSIRQYHYATCISSCLYCTPIFSNGMSYLVCILAMNDKDINLWIVALQHVYLVNVVIEFDRCIRNTYCTYYSYIFSECFEIIYTKL